MIYDCFTFNGEYDLLELRFNLLSQYVDKFIIVEGAETFSGKPKDLYWVNRNIYRFKEWENKVIYRIVHTYDDKDINEQMDNRMSYVDEPHFKRAFYQKETIRKVLESLNPSDEDVIFYGDADEVWRPEILEKFKENQTQTYKLRQLCYSYYLNNRSSEDWRGTIVTKWENLKNGCLNDMRAKPENILDNGGWHWTNQGGIEELKRKIDSYDHQEVNIPWVVDGLEERLESNTDFLGRSHDYQGKTFKFWVDESELPKWLIENKNKYLHLWK